MDSVWDQITRVVSVFATSEVKTPLSFVFRMSLYVALLFGLVLFAPVGDDFKRFAAMFFGGFLFLMFAFVVVFAWFKPRNLVYGEAGYRAERKLEYGTNRKIRSANQIDVEKGIENQGQLPLPPPDDVEDGQ